MKYEGPYTVTLNLLPMISRTTLARLDILVRWYHLNKPYEYNEAMSLTPSFPLALKFHMTIDLSVEIYEIKTFAVIFLL